jgi:hypothetical protein
MLASPDRGSCAQLLHRMRRPYEPAMMLCIQMGWSQSEVAQHFNVSLSTLKSRLSRARKELRAACSALLLRETISRFRNDVPPSQAMVKPDPILVRPICYSRSRCRINMLILKQSVRRTL